jgi:hypothetical protein
MSSRLLDDLSPAFLGQACIHLGSVVGAFVAGQIVPTPGRLKG